MSVNLYMSLETPTEGIDANDCDRVFLARWSSDLAALAKKLRLKPLESFYSYDSEDIADYLDDDSEASGESPNDLPRVTYFDASDALATIRGLTSFLTENAPRFTVIGGVDRRPDLLRELAVCESTLAKAAAREVRFRFWIGE
jgi:hypothetical protein